MWGGRSTSWLLLFLVLGVWVVGHTSEHPGAVPTMIFVRVSGGKQAFSVVGVGATVRLSPLLRLPSRALWLALSSTDKAEVLGQRVGSWGVVGIEEGCVMCFGASHA